MAAIGVEKPVAVVNGNEAFDDLESPQKGPKKGVNQWKFTVVIGFSVYVSILFFLYATRAIRMIPMIAAPDPLNGIMSPGQSPNITIAMVAFISTIVVAAILVVLWFVEPLMSRILKPWYMDTHDGSGISGIFARGLPCFRPPADAVQPGNEPKGKLIFALILAVLIVEIPMGIWAWGPVIHGTVGFPIDGDIIKANLCTKWANKCTAPKGNADALCEGTLNDAHGFEIHTDYNEASCTMDGEAPRMSATGPCKFHMGLCPSYQVPHPELGPPAFMGGGPDGVLIELRGADAPPSDTVQQMIEYEQMANFPAFFFMDLLINMPLIMFVALPLVMGPLSGCLCGKWMGWECGNCLTPCLGCMDQ